MPTCLVDNSEHPDDLSLHRHLKTLGIKPSVYYPKYLNKKDLLTGECIPFKDPSSYQASLFVSRKNLVEYLRKNPKNKEIISELILLRKNLKNLTKAPSTVESRTTFLPTPLLVQSLSFSYNAISQELGLIPIFDYSSPLSFHRLSLELIQDTREQNPIEFARPFSGSGVYSCLVSKLDFGDYTCRKPYKAVYIERKSLPDFCGTISGGYERFQREIERAKELGSYLVVVCEESLNTILELDTNKIHKRYSRATSSFLCHRIREICEKYDNIQFLFIKGRKEIAGIVEKIFRLKNDIAETDLQFFYDKGELK